MSSDPKAHESLIQGLIINIPNSQTKIGCALTLKTESKTT